MHGSFEKIGENRRTPGFSHDAEISGGVRRGQSLEAQ
jgi:hypothetical protein